MDFFSCETRDLNIHDIPVPLTFFSVVNEVENTSIPVVRVSVRVTVDY